MDGLLGDLSPGDWFLVLSDMTDNRGSCGDIYAHNNGKVRLYHDAQRHKTLLRASVAEPPQPLTLGRICDHLIGRSRFVSNKQPLIGHRDTG